jgi:LysM repeat protein
MEPVARTTYVVAPGDTLWSIARRLVPEGDVRPVVDSLAAHRNGRPLQVGERIALP